MEPLLRDLEAFAGELAADAERVLVLGMGGSSLAPLVFASSFGRPSGGPRLEVLDSTDPDAVAAAAGAAPPGRTIFVVSSKSGTTLEPNLFFDYFFDLARQELGARAGERFVVVTDPGTPMEAQARDRGVRRIFAGDPTIGGRYSALSPFGIVPAALAGIDVRQLLGRARRTAEACRAPAPEANPGAALGAAMGALTLAGRDKLTFSVGAPIDRFGMWAEQLVAESTGKEGRGILPVEAEPLGPPEAYGEDRFFVRIGLPGADPVAESALERLEAAGHPVARIDAAGALDLGAEMFRWEFATALAGAILEIDPFDQPNVQEAKDRTNEILSGAVRPGSGPMPGGVDTESLARFLDSLAPRDYFAITAYLPPTEENERRLSRVRLPVRDSRRVATTVGFGPRFLHSTGQLHKGGPDTGAFLQVTAKPLAAVPIPGRAYDFAAVLAAQAAGDLAALESRGRRTHYVHLEPDMASGLESLAEAVTRTTAIGKERG